MRILIAGSNGQIGRTLTKQLSSQYETVVGLDLPDIDITDRESVKEQMREHLPDMVINAAAFTNVDGCVTDFDFAYRVNALGPQNLALACAEQGADFVHISSNEVFPGLKREGYNEWDQTDPVNPYAVTKTAAEFYVRHSHSNHYIVRFSWLFAPGGNNFVHKILQAARAGKQLKVVNDEAANPTYVFDLCDAIVKLMVTKQYGTYHLPNSGICTRYEFARVALDAAGLESVPIEPISSSAFERLSTPPPECGLNNTAAKALGIELRPWQQAVRSYVSNYAMDSAETE